VITKPAAALERLIYPRGIEQKKGDVAAILQGFEKNHPFVAHLQRELAAHPDDLITKAVFSAFCRRAEKEIYGRRAASSFVADLQTHQNFCATIGPSSDHRLEAQAVIAMLRERGMQELAERIMPDLKQQKLWSIPEIERLLEERGSATEPFFPPPVISGPVSPPAAEFSPRPHAIPAVLENERGEPGVDSASEESSWPQVQAQIDLNLAPEETARDWALPEAPSSANGKDAAIPAAPVEAPPKVVYYDEDGEEPQLIERAKSEAQPPGPYPSITRLVDEKSRRDFIRKIFHKDLEAYLAFIERIEGMETWKEAKSYLDREFQLRRVNPYSKEAVRLSDVVFGRYFTKETK
jgi:hypothetical protein